MYTIKEASDLLSVSKVTLYKHMEKNNVEKGKKLTFDDFEILKKSISKNVKVNPLVNTLKENEKHLTKELNKKLIAIDVINSDLEKANIRIRELESLLSQKEILLNQSQIKQAELLSNNQKLIETKVKKSWWKK